MVKAVRFNFEFDSGISTNGITEVDTISLPQHVSELLSANITEFYAGNFIAYFNSDILRLPSNPTNAMFFTR